jgi:formylmethanofuran dehydrogenase subunit C
MHGGAGDDIFVAPDIGFGRLDGGGGNDTVRFDGGGFDLTGLRGDQLSGVESFDLTGTGDNTLILDADIALAATGGTNPLTGAVDSLLIDGDAGDAVTAQGAWTNTGTVTIGGNGYSVYQSDANGAQIFVDGDVAVSLA